MGIITPEQTIIQTLPWPLIHRFSAIHKLSPELIAAIIMAESAGNKWAVRIEVHWQYYLDIKKYARLNRITETTEKALQACSWGLMQIMGSVAREHNFDGPLHQLHEPELNLRYSCKHLAKFMQRHKNEHDAIAAYNAGTPIKGMDGRYKNNDYVVKVLNFKDTVKETMSQKEK